MFKEINNCIIVLFCYNIRRCTRNTNLTNTFKGQSFAVERTASHSEGTDSNLNLDTCHSDWIVHLFFSLWRVSFISGSFDSQIDSNSYGMKQLLIANVRSLRWKRTCHYTGYHTFFEMKIYIFKDITVHSILNSSGRFGCNIFVRNIYLLSPDF
jgi:hypothetical protein